MTDDIFYDPFTEEVPANAQKERLLTGRARYVYILSATGAVSISINGGEFFTMPVSLGMEFPDGFTRIKLRDESGSANTVEVIVTSGKIDDRRLNVNGSINATVLQNTGLSGVDDVTVSTGGAAVVELRWTLASERRGCLVATDRMRVSRAFDASDAADETAPDPRVQAYSEAMEEISARIAGAIETARTGAACL